MVYPTYINNFVRTLERKELKNKIQYDIEFQKQKESISLFNGVIDIEDIPASITEFHQIINTCSISNPRRLKLLSPTDFQLIENNYIVFSIIDSKHRIGFNANSKNEAAEWNIINIDTDYLITKSLSSFVTNKIWEWIDRGRNIWEEEVYT